MAYFRICIFPIKTDSNSWLVHTGLQFEPRHDKTNKMNVHPAKTQISLGIRPVWSVFAVRIKKAWVLSYPLSAQRRLWSDWADALADLSLRRAHSHLLGFVMSRLMLSIKTASYSQFMGIWLTDLYATYATQFLPKKCKVFIFVQYMCIVKLHLKCTQMYHVLRSKPNYERKRNTSS